MDKLIKQQLIASFDALEVDKNTKRLFRVFIDRVEDADAELNNLYLTIKKQATIVHKDLDKRIKEIIGTAPSTLDSLRELASALNNDSNFATRIVNDINELKERINSTNNPLIAGQNINITNDIISADIKAIPLTDINDLFLDD